MCATNVVSKVRNRTEARGCPNKIVQLEGMGSLIQRGMGMNLPKVISDLRAELADVERAIESLERLTGGSRKRGRPPKWRRFEQEPAMVAKAPMVRAAGAGMAEGPSGSD
jgi:hypothetical protein